jgi:hypothetical protein
MKNLYLLAIGLYISFLSVAQDKTENNLTFEKGDFAISYAFGPGLHNQQHQLTVDYFISDSWSLVYRGSVNIAQSSLYTSEYILPIGATVGVGALSLGTCGACSGFCSFDQGFGLIGYSFLIPDGVSFHIYPFKNIDIAPYFIFSGLGIYQTSEETNFFYSPSVGVRVSLSSKKFPFGAFLDPQMRGSYDGMMIPQVLGGLMLRF